MEFVLGISRLAKVTHGGDMREIAMYWKLLNEKLGRRGRDLTLPIDWSSSGFFSALYLDGSWIVKERFTGVEVELQVDASGSCVPLIDLNYSRTHATLISRE